MVSHPEQACRRAAAVGAVVLAAGLGDLSTPLAQAPSQDALPSCNSRSRYALFAPKRLPYDFKAGIAVAARSDPDSTDLPAGLRIRVDPLPGRRLSHPYAGGGDKGSIGAKHYLVFPLRFVRGDAGARITVTFTEYSGSIGNCTQRFVRDIPAMPARGVRARVTRVRVTSRTVTISGRISRRAGRRPAYVVVLAYTTPPGFNRIWRMRVRGRHGRFRRVVRSRLNPGESADYVRAKAWFPGNFSDPAPQIVTRF